MDTTKNRYSVHIFPGKDRHRIFLSEISNVRISAYHIVRERDGNIMGERNRISVGYEGEGCLLFAHFYFVASVLQEACIALIKTKVNKQTKKALG